jgi:PAS domain S-box-containing protein
MPKGAAQRTGPAEDLERLRESEERFRRTFELAGSGLAHIGPDRRFIRVNRRLCEIFGYSEAELLKLRGRDISHPEDADVINRQRPRLYAGEIDEVRLEKRYLRKDGSTVWVHFAMVLERDADGRPKYEIAVYDDITARREAEERLRQSEERYRRTFELAGSGLAHVSLDGRFLRVNPRVCDLLGYSEAELRGRMVKDLSHPDDRDLADGPRARVFAGELESARLEKRYLRKDGRVVWANLAIALERDAGGRPLYAISVLEDITARKEAEEALRQSEERFRKSFELAASGVAHVDLDGRFMRLNRSLTRILGYDESELVGRSVKEVSHPEDRDVTDAQRALVRSGHRESVRFEKRYIRKDGAVVWVSLGVALVRSGGGARQ